MQLTVELCTYLPCGSSSPRMQAKREAVPVETREADGGGAARGAGERSSRLHSATREGCAS